jgi:DNA-binding beta-propeller fold protein YncE
VIGGPDADVFDNPYDCVWDPTTKALYVTDQSNPSATPDGIGDVIYEIQ